MPTNRQRVMGALTSVGITIGGAWLAGTINSRNGSEPQRYFENGIEITLNGIRNNIGKIIVIVFSEPDAFKAYDLTKTVGYREIPAHRDTVHVQFLELNSGPYAVVAFHDEDDNKDLNMLGNIPTEGYATSGALDAYDMPTFANASLKNDRAALTMNYANGITRTGTLANE